MKRTKEELKRLSSDPMTGKFESYYGESSWRKVLSFYVFLLLLLIFVAVMASCKSEPEFYIDGIAYYTRQRCIENHVEVRKRFDYVGYHTYGVTYAYKTVLVTVCDKYATDTLKIQE